MTILTQRIKRALLHLGGKASKMKIVRRGSKSTAKFRVIKNNFFLAGGHQPEIGEVLEFIGQDGMSTALGLCQQGKLCPDDLPTLGRYIVISPFDMPGKIEKFRAETNDIVELKSSDGLALMLRRKVVPANKDQWSPYRLREKRKMKDIFEAPQHSDGKTKISYDWKVTK